MRDAVALAIELPCCCGRWRPQPSVRQVGFSGPGRSRRLWTPDRPSFSDPIHHLSRLWLCPRVAPCSPERVGVGGFQASLPGPGGCCYGGPDYGRTRHGLGKRSWRPCLRGLVCGNLYWRTSGLNCRIPLSVQIATVAPAPMHLSELPRSSSFIFDSYFPETLKRSTLRWRVSWRI